MEKVTSLSDYKVKKILGDMSDIVLNDDKRERILGDIMQVKAAYESEGVNKVSEPKITYKYDGYNITEFTGRWKVKNKELFVEVKYHYMAGNMYGVYQSIEESFVNSERITWDEEWPTQGVK